MSDKQREQLEQRLKSLETRLNEDKKGRDKSAGDKSGRSGFGLGMKLSSEFIVSIAVGAGLGYTVDWFLGTKALGMIIFLFIGFCAGVLNIMRSAGMVQEPDIMLGQAERKKRAEARQKARQDDAQEN